MRNLFKFLLFFALAFTLKAQVKVIDSDGLHFKSLIASFYEPKMGLMKYFDRNSLKVDIGNSLDLFEFNLNRIDLTLGVDFFAYTLVNNHGFLVLRVEAIDGFFGGNLSASKDELSARLRILHRSAHLVDEYGELGRKPFPFTREFADLVFSFAGKNFRAYGGVSYVFRTKPSDVKKFHFQSGFEFFKVLSENFTFLKSKFLFIFASDLKFFDGVDAINFTSGFKFGRWNSRGIFLYVVYYSGFDIYGQYFNLKRNFGGLGCSFEF